MYRCAKTMLIYEPTTNKWTDTRWLLPASPRRFTVHFIEPYLGIYHHDHERNKQSGANNTDVQY